MEEKGELSAPDQSLAYSNAVEGGNRNINLNKSMEDLGMLHVVPVTSRLDLIAKPVADLITALKDKESIGVAEIDPSLSDTAAFCEHYEIDPARTVNCVVVKAKRADKEWYAACAIFATTKADVNGLVR